MSRFEHYSNLPAADVWALFSRTVLGSVGDEAKQQDDDLVGLCSVVAAVLSPIPEHRDSPGCASTDNQQGRQRRWDRSEHGDNDALARRKPGIVLW